MSTRRLHTSAPSPARWAAARCSTTYRHGVRPSRAVSSICFRNNQPGPGCSGFWAPGCGLSPFSFTWDRHDSRERGEALAPGRGDERLDVGLARERLGRRRIEIAPQAVLADTPPEDLLAVHVIDDAPVRQRRNPL